MDSVLAWLILTCTAWYGGFRMLIIIIEADEARKARSREEWDEHGW